MQKRGKTKRRAKPSTALVRRPQRLEIQLRDPARRMPALEPIPTTGAALMPSTLGDEVSIGDFGLAELILKPEEEAELSKPINVDELMIKPTGQPYLSHPSYTRWFNRAFGRLGWRLAPRSKPMKSGTSVVCPYLLYIHGQAVAFAWGEQEYHESNREQSYGDALEATLASALRRCAKHLGVGIELWEKPFLDRFVDEHCVKVACDVENRSTGETKVKYLWRRKTDRPFWNEKGTRSSGRPPSGSSAADVEEGEVIQQQTRQPGTHAAQNDPITEPQIRRLWALVKKAGRDKDAVKAWIAISYDVTSSKDIKRKDYEEICTAIEAPGGLPKPRGVDA